MQGQEPIVILPTTCFTLISISGHNVRANKVYHFSMCDGSKAKSWSAYLCVEVGYFLLVSAGHEEGVHGAF